MHQAFHSQSQVIFLSDVKSMNVGVRGRERGRVGKLDYFMLSL